MTAADPRPLPDRWIPLATGAVAVVELVVLRIATRSFVNIPGLDRWATPLRAVGEAGRVSYYVAVVLTVVTWGWVLRNSAATNFGPRMLLAAATVGFAGAAAAYRLGVLGGEAMGWASLASVAALAMVAEPGRRRIPVVLFGGAAVLTGLGTYFGASGIAQLTLSALLVGGEVLAVAAGISAPLVLGERLTRRATGLGLAVAFAATLALAWRPSPFRVLVLWSFGMPVSLPAWTYGLAAGLVTATVWQAWSNRRWGMVGGLLLLFSGGVGLISTYQSALVVAGLAALAIELDRPLPNPGMLPQPEQRSLLSRAGTVPAL
ncbi:MAG TPA: hypothetical protein VLA54_09815 [Acidimicrobiia bacterium]|nr:hypothetical protein [Acidimicrobiia bacterium]